MSANAIVTTALSAVLSNSWAVELPPDVAYPAIVFTIETDPEDQWCMNGGYDQHLVTVVTLSETAEGNTALLPQVRAAFEALASFMFEEGSGDVEFEDDPNVYAYFISFRLRVSRY